MGSMTTAAYSLPLARRIKRGVSLSMGTDLPLRFHRSMFPLPSGEIPSPRYTSRNRRRQLTLSSSRFT